MLGQFELVGKYKQFWQFDSGITCPVEINTISQLSDGTFIFAGNRPNATNGVGEDARLIRTDNKFKPLSYMIIRNGGHGSGLGTHLNENGSIDCYLTLPQTDKISDKPRLVTFKYEDNTILNCNDGRIKVLRYFEHMNNEAIISHDGKKLITVEHGEDINLMGLDIWGIEGTELTQKPLYTVPFKDIHQGLFKDGKNLNIYQGIGWSPTDDTIWIAWGYQGHQPNDIQYDPTNIINVDYTNKQILYTKNVDINDPIYQLNNGSTLEIEGITSSVDGLGLYIIIIGGGSYYNDLTDDTTRGHIYYVPFEGVH